MKIVATHYIPPHIYPKLPENIDTVMPESGAYGEEELKAHLADADALLILRGSFGENLGDCAPKLKAVATVSVGYDRIDCEYAREKGVAVINTPETVREATAEVTIALMMAVMRCVVRFDRFSREELKTMDREFGSPCRRLFGKTLGIVGMGSIGEAVARRAAGLGMKVVYNNSSGARENSVGAEYMPLDDLLKTADVVSLHMPLNEKTKGMIGKRELSLMKPSAYLVNMARGPVVDELALIETLREGKIAGAALDVFSNEPEISPELAALSNVVLSPHVGTFDDETRAEMVAEAVNGIVEVLNGRHPANRVV